MAATFPTTPTGSRAVRLGAVAIGLAVLLLAARVTSTSGAWGGRVFPGSPVSGNRGIRWAGLPGGPAPGAAGFYESEVTAVAGAPVASGAEIYARAGAVEPGTPVRYRVRRGGDEREVLVPARVFTEHD